MRIALQELVDYCSAKEDAEICFPFGDVPICFKYDGHIFVEIYPNDSDYKITVRCNPDIGACYREQGAVVDKIPRYDTKNEVF